MTRFSRRPATERPHRRTGSNSTSGIRRCTSTGKSAGSQFNHRVLHEALDPRTPLLERLKFLGIYSSNLDEFFQVRVAGLKRQVAAGFTERTSDGLTAEDQLARISVQVREQLAQHRHGLMQDVLPSLAEKGLQVISHLGDIDRANARPPRPLLPVECLPGADAPRGRSGASLPLHLEPEPLRSPWSSAAPMARSGLPG